MNLWQKIKTGNLHPMVAMCLVYMLVIGAVALVMAMDFQDEVHEKEHYCSMVEAFVETDGEYGWPDYKGTYDKYCD
ncbi:hypothetical protein [Vibrio phage VpKK5]|uniref:hypothetical protein n=1 Tax=Vibrio phage VpKK5 TaxID=1538804 RepID=UPI0004F62393|nr:hypothetical protein VC55_gp38 [Vibrio phage VpKK5]AIM40623.1 hypothetical protein [Vibrio phage VpKK5]